MPLVPRIAAHSGIRATFPSVVTGLAVLVGGYCLARALLVLVFPSSIMPAPPAGSAGTAPALAPLDHSVLARLDPFWPEAAVSPALAENAPQTRLNLTLFAVRVTAQGAGSATIGLNDAVLGTGSVAQRVYQIGEEIAPGVTLHGVLADRVLLSREGVIEVLRFPADQDADAPRAILPLTTAPADAPDSVAPTGTSPAVQSWGELIRRAQIQPVYDQDRLVGLGFAPSTDPGLLARYGLRASDRITGINGQSLSGNQDISSFAASLSNETSVELAILRDDKIVTRSIAFE